MPNCCCCYIIKYFRVLLFSLQAKNGAVFGPQKAIINNMFPGDSYVALLTFNTWVVPGFFILRTCDTRVLIVSPLPSAPVRKSYLYPAVPIF